MSVLDVVGQFLFELVVGHACLLLSGLALSAPEPGRVSYGYQECRTRGPHPKTWCQRCPAHGRPTDLDLQILDLLREDAKSAGRLAEVLTHEGERVDPEAVRLRLRALARRGLVVVGSPANPRADAGVGGSARADMWEITEEGRALAESQAGV